jgi:uroporphyrinogen-III synthase
MRVAIPEDMKYFCATETIALYIQKYVQYRKRKVVFGDTGKLNDIIPAMMKHKQEKYLIPMSDVHNNNVKELLDSKKLHHQECVMYRTVSNDFTPEEVKTFDYDMLIFFSPSGVQSLKKNFPNFKQGDIVIGTLGPTTAKAVRDAGLRLDIEAPSPQYPSISSAIDDHLRKANG